ncbi:GMC oxidoreductase-domain-containing protein [Mycena sp. CBHHK59/15]|nr:GMC oxidoreductase-domain-containing protein [Mycena sp. CBHHK59/15]
MPVPERRLSSLWRSWFSAVVTQRYRPQRASHRVWHRECQRLPGVGVHLQDHVGVPLMYEVPLKDTLHNAENSIRKGALELGKYLFARTAIMASTVAPMSMFAHSTHLDDKDSTVISSNPSTAEESNRPDLEIMAIAHWTASREIGGVVDDELKIYGVHRLRVCDASVFPCITSGHTMAVVIAIAENCADLMRNP